MFYFLNNIQSRWFKNYLLCFFSIFSFTINSQPFLNRVKNSSFEQSNKCTSYFNNLRDADFWFSSTAAGSPDYFNSCSTSSVVSSPINFYGKQVARTGSSYAGFGTIQYGFTDSREYVEIGLVPSLDSSKKFCVTFYISLSENSRLATANIGVYFTKDSLVNPTPLWPPYVLNNTPDYETATIVTDTLNWRKIETVHIGTGKENFITIGSFKNDATINKQQVKILDPTTTKNYAYYYIDDISVVEIISANASIKDTIFKCSLDSILLGTDSTEFATYSWFPSSGLSCTNCPNPIAKPTITTKYYLTKQQCSATTMDSVIVSILTPSTPANAGPDKTICSGESAVLGTDSIVNVFYSWQEAGAGGSSLSCTNCPLPTAIPDSSTSYILTRQECSFISYDTVRVFIDDCNPTFTVPTVFTPNYDGVNDTWGIKFSSINHIKDFSVNVYDRWGLLLFSSNPGNSKSDFSTPNIKWDGRTVSGEECSSGTYFYIITFTKNDEVQKLKGFVSLFK